MPQYWIQTPVENAKEVVQRYLDANSGTLTAYAGATVSYDDQCEVVFYGGDLANLTYDFNIIYFGNLIVYNNTYGGYLDITDAAGGEIYTFDMGELNANAETGIYPSIIWSRNPVGWQTYGFYFIGYKFNITTP